MIWKAALPGPRLVYIRQRPLKETIGEWETRTGKEWPEMMGSLRQQEEEEADGDVAMLNTENNDEDEDDESAEHSSDDEDAEPELRRDVWNEDEVEHNRSGMRAEMGKAIHASEYYRDSYKDARML